MLCFNVFLSVRDSLSRGRKPSQLPLHEKWKRDRQRPDGEFTPEATHIVAENIVSIFIVNNINCGLIHFGNKILFML